MAKRNRKRNNVQVEEAAGAIELLGECADRVRELEHQKNRRQKCQTCGGTGRVSRTNSRGKRVYDECSVCGGKGYV